MLDSIRSSDRPLRTGPLIFLLNFKPVFLSWILMERLMNRISRFACGALVAAFLACPASANETTKGPRKSEPAKSTTAVLHCEVPCGIYADQMRFEMMLEDTHTIAKAITNINEFADSLNEGPPSATAMNQVTRWINTKESHATNTQHVVAQYFLTQRIKADHKDYAKQLAAAHSVMVAAMKCKQNADPATAEALEKAILDLYRAYEGKEPKLEKKK